MSRAASFKQAELARLFRVAKAEGVDLEIEGRRVLVRTSGQPRSDHDEVAAELARRFGGKA